MLPRCTETLLIASSLIGSEADTMVGVKKTFIFKGRPGPFIMNLFIMNHSATADRPDYSLVHYELSANCKNEFQVTVEKSSTVTEIHRRFNNGAFEYINDSLMDGK